MSVRPRELDIKQLSEMIEAIYQILHENEGVISAPSSEQGIFKYSGYAPQTQHYLTRMSRKRDAKRTGLGFVIRWAEFYNYYRLSVDVEISSEVTGKEPQTIFENAHSFTTTEYNAQAPALLLYAQPAYSGKRGWAEKVFMGFEIEMNDRDLENINRFQKKLLDQIHKLLRALDYALVEA